MERLKARSIRRTKVFVLFIFLLVLFYFIFLGEPEIELRDDSSYYLSPTYTIPHIQLVISHYGDTLSWLNDVTSYLELDNRRDDILCYCKNDRTNPNVCPHIIRRPNIGRVDETYLYHIIHNYDRLPDYTIFMPDTSFDKHKLNFSWTLLKLFKEKKSTILLGHVHEKFLYSHLYYLKVEKYLGFYQNQWNGETVLCGIRPFGVWYNHFFDIKEKSHIKLATYYTMFVVSREHIRQTSLQKYKELLSHLQNGDSLECGHFMERSWSSVFDPPSSSLFSFQYPDAIVNAVNGKEFQLKEKESLEG
jgi:hypothetical protein